MNVWIPQEDGDEVPAEIDYEVTDKDPSHGVFFYDYTLRIRSIDGLRFGQPVDVGPEGLMLTHRQRQSIVKQIEQEEAA